MVTYLFNSLTILYMLYISSMQLFSAQPRLASQVQKSEIMSDTMVPQGFGRGGSRRVTHMSHCRIEWPLGKAPLARQGVYTLSVQYPYSYIQNDVLFVVLLCLLGFDVRTTLRGGVDL